MGLNFDHLENQVRTYAPSDSAVFWKTREKFGGLSNMAAGFPLLVNGVKIRTSEALYQAMRFPTRPDVQELILGEISPMTAKMRSKPFREFTRDDWSSVRVPIMRWCLRLKLYQNWEKFGHALRETGSLPIVEKKTKHADFWGAKYVEPDELIGPNILGRLLMELRDDLEQMPSPPEHLAPLNLKQFLLLGREIEAVRIVQSPVSILF
ncbi:NADAR family protein [Sphingomonas sabuli]|uniref:NADAR family protein n=1 Tax=Sphingomonas sabuli TaxID=2764186 RepID=A0A7G9KZL6_9SPHN|nr:NADAR family protein [Sphingomonas sabuli]QNM81815.1 NADAR family protein [Sphingomonas sabuli]